MSEITTDDVRQAFDALDTVETEVSELADGIRVSASEEEAGQFFRVMRQNDFDGTTRRVDDALVAHIAAEETRGLGDLFG